MILLETFNLQVKRIYQTVCVSFHSSKSLAFGSLLVWQSCRLGNWFTICCVHSPLCSFCFHRMYTMTLFSCPLCQILGGCLVGFCGNNTSLQWVQILATVNDDCPDYWVCTEFPTLASAGLPWWIHPSNQTHRDWPKGWKASDPLFKQMHEEALSLMREQANHTMP